MEHQTLSNVKVSKDKSHQMADDLMGIRMKEAEAVAELQENKLKLMELETQVCTSEIVIRNSGPTCFNNDPCYVISYH